MFNNNRKFYSILIAVVLALLSIVVVVNVVNGVGYTQPGLPVRAVMLTVNAEPTATPTNLPTRGSIFIQDSSVSNVEDINQDEESHFDVQEGTWIVVITAEPTIRLHHTIAPEQMTKTPRPTETLAPYPPPVEATETLAPYPAP